MLRAGYGGLLAPSLQVGCRGARGGANIEGFRRNQQAMRAPRKYRIGVWYYLAPFSTGGEDASGELVW